LRKLSFEDYHWKSGIPIWILALWTTGRRTKPLRGRKEDCCEAPVFLLNLI